jgi:hypothetical protein
MRAGVAYDGLVSSVLFILYVNEMHSTLHHVEFSFYADNTAIIATPPKPTLLFGYPEIYVNDL